MAGVIENSGWQSTFQSVFQSYVPLILVIKYIVVRDAHKEAYKQLDLNTKIGHVILRLKNVITTSWQPNHSFNIH